MNMKIIGFKIDVLDNDFDFNWAKVSFSEQAPDGGNSGGHIEIKVPKSINDIEGVMAYALNGIRMIDLKSLGSPDLK